MPLRILIAASILTLAFYAVFQFSEFDQSAGSSTNPRVRFILTGESYAEFRNIRIRPLNAFFPVRENEHVVSESELNELTLDFSTPLDKHKCTEDELANNPHVKQEDYNRVVCIGFSEMVVFQSRKIDRECGRTFGKRNDDAPAVQVEGQEFRNIGEPIMVVDVGGIDSCLYQGTEQVFLNEIHVMAEQAGTTPSVVVWRDTRLVSRLQPLAAGLFLTLFGSLIGLLLTTMITPALANYANANNVALPTWLKLAAVVVAVALVGIGIMLGQLLSGA